MGTEGGRFEGAARLLAHIHTWAFLLPDFASLQVQAQDVIERCQLYQSQGRDLLHVHRRQVSYPGHTQSAFGNSEPLGQVVKSQSGGVWDDVVGVTGPWAFEWEKHRVDETSIGDHRALKSDLCLLLHDI